MREIICGNVQQVIRITCWNAKTRRCRKLKFFLFFRTLSSLLNLFGKIDILSTWCLKWTAKLKFEKKWIQTWKTFYFLEQHTQIINCVGRRSNQEYKTRIPLLGVLSWMHVKTLTTKQKIKFHNITACIYQKLTGLVQLKL